METRIKAREQRQHGAQNDVPFENARALSVSDLKLSLKKKKSAKIFPEMCRLRAQNASLEEVSSVLKGKNERLLTNTSSTGY